MLRSALSSCRSVYTCLCLHNAAVRTSALQKPASLLGARLLHGSSSVQVLHKDMRGKQTQIASSQEEKFADAKDSPADIEGLFQAGFMTPTWETHDMVVDGMKYSDLPIIFIQSTQNNTIISMTDANYVRILFRSCGLEGFKNAKKSSAVAAQATGFTVGSRAVKKGFRSVRVMIKGLGVGREASLTGLKMGGLNIVSISDRTPLIIRKPKPRKQRRL